MITLHGGSCPKCGAERDKHGEGGDAICKMQTPGECLGLRRETDADNPRQRGRCYHCGWAGKLDGAPQPLAALVGASPKATAPRGQVVGRIVEEHWDPPTFGLESRYGTFQVSCLAADRAAVHANYGKEVAAELELQLDTDGSIRSGRLLKLIELRDVGDDPLSKIHGAMKGVFSGPEADAYFDGLSGAQESPEDALERLAELPPGVEGWDAPPPSAWAIAKAREVVEMGRAAELPEPDVDADAMGGVAVTYFLPDGSRLWVACMNTERTSAIRRKRLA